MTKSEKKLTQTHLHIGEIYREHGVKGFCKAYIYSQSDDNLLEGESYILQAEDGRQKEVKLSEVSTVGRYFLLHFAGFQSPEQIEGWRKAGIWIAKTKLAQDDEMYDYEWVGFEILDTKKQSVGTVKEIAYTPLRQFLITPSVGSEVLIPYNKDWIVNLDKKTKTLVLDLPEGLLEV
jgi:16S rRNA processing protein RimM